jgi:hypothetical protein
MTFDGIRHLTIGLKSSNAASSATFNDDDGNDGGALSPFLNFSFHRF